VFSYFFPTKRNRQFPNKSEKNLTGCTLEASQGSEIKMYITLSKETTYLKYGEDISYSKSGKERIETIQYSLKSPILKKYFLLIFFGVSSSEVCADLPGF